MNNIWNDIADLRDEVDDLGTGPFQPGDSDLTAIAALTPTNDDVIQRKSGAWVNRSMSQLRTDLALVVGTNVQAWDADLDAIAAISGTSGLLKKTAANTWSLDTSTYATQAYADALVVGLLDDRGNYSASGNTFPASGGSGAAGAILKGDLWTISVAGTLGGHPVTVGDVVRALVDSPGQTDSNWAIGENNFGYVALNQALADGKMYVGNGSGIGTAVTPSGDVTFTNAGVTAIGAGKVTSAMLAGSIDATKIADGTVTSAEFQFINSLTSNAQTQIDAKAQSASPTFTGTVTSTGAIINLSGSSALNHHAANIALQLGGNAMLFGSASRGANSSWNLALNAYYDQTANSWKYVSTDKAAYYQQFQGEHSFSVIVSGTAGANIASWSEVLRITNATNVKIGGTAVRGTTEGTNHLDIFNGTAPVGTLANGVSLYVTAGELRVMDAGGTATLLSQHAKDAPEWMYDDEDVMPPDISHESNCFTGTVRYVNHTRTARLQQTMFDGDRLPADALKRRVFHEETFDQYNKRQGLSSGDPRFLVKVDWDAEQERLVIRSEQEIAEWNGRDRSLQTAKPKKHVKQPKPNWLKDTGKEGKPK